jgi:hypothetical protein
MKYTVQDFAKEIKKKYPKVYNDLDDEELVNLWVKKYPQDKKNIDFTKTQESSLQKSDGFFVRVWDILKGFILFALGSLIIAFLIDFGVDFYTKINNNSNYNLNSIEEIVLDIFSKSDNVLEKHQSDFPITQEADDYINNGFIIKLINLDSDTKSTLLDILSDPYLNNIEGQFCDNSTTRCHYCNNVIPGKLKSYQSILKGIVDNDRLEQSLKKGTAHNISSSTNSDPDWDNYWEDFEFEAVRQHVIDLKPAIVEMCSSYRKGIKYLCIEEPVAGSIYSFCSEKCKTEYNYSH